ncbi:MAG TPA: glycosyltransferase, partial [Candidatus Obscuribacterales bacterium]
MPKPNHFKGMETLERSLRSLGADTSAPYRLLIRKGRVLCAIPRDQKVALRTLDLYQPQRGQGKLLKAIIRTCIKLGIPCPLLRAWQAEEGHQGAGKQAGVMVGSPGHLCERSVAVFRDPQVWTVVKLAFGEAGTNILKHEADMLESLEKNIHTPDLRSFTSDGDEAKLCMGWQDGIAWSNPDISPIVQLLREWHMGSDPLPLEVFKEWNTASQILKSYPIWGEAMKQWEELKLAPSIRHGDLTRPNLRTSCDGKDLLLVHDWERGAHKGMPAIDLAHYLIQDSCFTRSWSPDEVIRTVIQQLRAHPCRGLLIDLGWRDQVYGLLATTIAFNIGSQYFSNDSLLRALGDAFLEEDTALNNGQQDKTALTSKLARTKFSIITPSYNQSEYIEDCLESVRTQKADGIEIEHIIIDAQSTDGTVDILEKQKDILWRSEPDKGISDAINKGFLM